MSQFTEDQFNKMMERAEKMKAEGSVDLSLEEDLSIAVMNLISLEEHFFFTAEKTKKEEYLDLLDEVRAMRKELLGRMVPEHEGETWCVSKHLLAAAMRVMEVATKLRGEGKHEEARKMFDNAYKIYGLFWGVRLRLVDLSGAKKMREQDKPWTVEDLVEKMVDCCGE